MFCDADRPFQAFQAAEMVEAPILRQAALFHAEHNLSRLSQREGFREALAGTPGLAEVRASGKKHMRRRERKRKK